MADSFTVLDLSITTHNRHIAGGDMLDSKAKNSRDSVVSHLKKIIFLKQRRKATAKLRVSNDTTFRAIIAELRASM